MSDILTEAMREFGIKKVGVEFPLPDHVTVTWYDGSKDPHTEGDTLEACITRKARAVTRKRAIDEFNSRQHEEFKRFVEELDK